jgi:hypothetical protein
MKYQEWLARDIDFDQPLQNRSRHHSENCHSGTGEHTPGSYGCVQLNYFDTNVIFAPESSNSLPEINRPPSAKKTPL